MIYLGVIFSAWLTSAVTVLLGEMAVSIFDMNKSTAFSFGLILGLGLAVVIGYMFNIL